MRRAPVERSAGNEHVHDLAGIAAQLRAEPHPASGGHRQLTIVHHGPVTLVLFDFEADGRLVDHVADGLVTIQTLAGHVAVRSSESGHELGAGSLLVLSPGVARTTMQSTPPIGGLLAGFVIVGPGPVPALVIGAAVIALPGTAGLMIPALDEGHTGSPAGAGEATSTAAALP